MLLQGARHLSGSPRWGGHLGSLQFSLHLAHLPVPGRWPSVLSISLLLSRPKGRPGGLCRSIWLASSKLEAAI